MHPLWPRTQGPTSTGPVCWAAPAPYTSFKRSPVQTGRAALACGWSPAARSTPAGANRTEQAPLWGLGRTVALEHSELWGGLIDLDPSSPEAMAEALSSQLTATDTEDQVAFREGQRYVARLIRARICSAVSEGAMHADAGYLVTGGLGGPLAYRSRPG